MKKSNNTIGIIIMACVLGFAGMKAFDIEFNMHNLKMMLAFVAGSVILLMLLFSLPGKKHETHEEYYERERLRQQQEQEELAYQTKVNQDNVNQDNVTPRYEESYQQSNQPEPDNRYNQYQQPYQNPYQQNNGSEEDNRWS